MMVAFESRLFFIHPDYRSLSTNEVMPAAAPVVCDICALPMGDRYATFIAEMAKLSEEFQMHAGINGNIAIFANASDGSSTMNAANEEYIRRTGQLLTDLGFDSEKRHCCRCSMLTFVDWCGHAGLRSKYTH